MLVLFVSVHRIVASSKLNTFVPGKPWDVPRKGGPRKTLCPCGGGGRGGTRLSTCGSGPDNSWSRIFIHVVLAGPAVTVGGAMFGDSPTASCAFVSVPTRSRFTSGRFE